jgi:hypothetical protein
MNIKLNRISYSALFSGLGVFSFFLLANYAELSDRVSDALYSVGMFLFFILAFNLLGYSTIRLTTWVDNQYSVNIHRRWKLIFIYTMVMLMFFLLNYGLLVTAKFLVGASHHHCINKNQFPTTMNIHRILIIYPRSQPNSRISEQIERKNKKQKHSYRI